LGILDKVATLELSFMQNGGRSERVEIVGEMGKGIQESCGTRGDDKKGQCRIERGRNDS